MTGPLLIVLTAFGLSQPIEFESAALCERVRASLMIGETFEPVPIPEVTVRLLPPPVGIPTMEELWERARYYEQMDKAARDVRMAALLEYGLRLIGAKPKLIEFPQPKLMCVPSLDDVELASAHQ